MKNENQDVVLITGGNKGLGYETAKELIALGYKVYIGCRNSEREEQAAKELKASFVLLDVTDTDTIQNAFKIIEENEGHLDVLINNAGVSGIPKPCQEITGADMEKIFSVNVYGAVNVTHVFLPLLKKGKHPRIVFVSSGLGSFSKVTDTTQVESKVNSLTYCSSKAALSMVALQYSKALPEMKINCADPQSTATDLNHHRRMQSVEEGCKAIVRLATLPVDGPTGRFFDQNGPIGW